MEKMSVGEIIRDHRKRLGLTQQELAQAIGVESRAMVWAMEHGEARIPMERIEKLAEVFGIKVAELGDQLEQADPKKYAGLIKFARSYAASIRMYRPGPPVMPIEMEAAAASGVGNMLRAERRPAVDITSLLGHERPRSTYYQTLAWIADLVRRLVGAVAAWPVTFPEAVAAI